MSQDTRKDPRAKIVSLNVRYKSATVDEFIDNHSHDVSKGGLFIKTSSPFPPGTLLKFEIRIAGDKAVIAGVGRVVWKRETAQAGPELPAGMGVKFIKIDDASRAVIDKLIESRGEGRNAYDEGVADGGAAAAHAPDNLAAAAAAAVKAAAKPAPAPGPTGASHEGAPFRPAPSASKIPAAGGKPTMMGIGGLQEAIAGQKPAVPADEERTVARSPAAGRPASDEDRTVARSPAAGRSADERPRAAVLARPHAAPASTAPSTTPMFPKSDSKADMPPKNEQTVMKQAAELLEEALLGAGGSMDEIGQNPLFDQVDKGAKDGGGALDALKKAPSTDEGQATVHGIGPVDLKDLAKKSADEAPATTKTEPPAEAKNAAATEADGSKAAPTLPSMTREPSEVDSTLRSATGEEAEASPKPKAASRPPKEAAKPSAPARPAVPAPEPPPNSKALFWVVGAAAVGVLGYLFYSQISEPSDSDKSLDTVPTPSVTAKPFPMPEPAVTASAVPSAAPTESASAAASASAAPAASSAAAASASAAPPASASAAVSAAPPPAIVAPVVQPKPQPPPPPKPKPPPPETTATTASTEAAPAPKPAPAPAPKPKPKPKPEDDNPY